MGYSGAVRESRESMAYRQLIAAPPARVAAAVAPAAGKWGADWIPGDSTGSGGSPPDEAAGRLRLPVAAGIRRGVLDGELWLAASASGSAEAPEGEDIPAGPATRVEFRPRDSVYFVDTKIAVVLTISALGGLLVVVWPFLPPSEELAQIVPLGVVLALAGWLLVVSRLENRGVEEFLDLLALEAEDGPDEDGGG